MKKTLRLFGAALIAAGFAGTAFAGDQTFNFDVDPGSDITLAGSLLAGTHAYTTVLGNAQLWSSGAGVATNGNPATGGYLSITDSTNNGNSLVFVFPDVDAGLPIKGFQIDMDLRIGNGTLGRPADGFSVSFARAGDAALVNATNGVANGFAGGDSLAAARTATGSIDMENGTKSGVAVIFDAWQGNYLPDTPPNDGSSTFPVETHTNDREGMAIRVDDVTILQANLINNRNWRDCATGGFSTIQSNLTDGTNNVVYGATGGPYIGGVSLQTGTNALVTAGSVAGCNPTFGNTDATGSFTNLNWEHLMVRLTNIPGNPQPRLTVQWKGITMVDTNLSSFSPTVGRLILAGRTGGNNENTHADNIHVVTTPTTNAYLLDVVGLPKGFFFDVSDNGSAVVVPSGILKVRVDGADVTGSTVVTNLAPLTTGVYTQATNWITGSSHLVEVTWVDNYNATNIGAKTFTANFVVFPAAYALPLSAINTSQIGVNLTARQTFQVNPNTANWTDEQVMGFHGLNLISGVYPTSFDGPLDFYNGAGKNPGPGFFANNLDLSTFGIGVGTYDNGVYHDLYDNCSLEMSAYVYFPTSGIYNMVLGSDDGFQMSVASNPKDRMGTVVWNLDGSRLPNTTAGGTPTAADIRQVVVDAAGAYPIRLLWENGGGQAGMEWYTMTDVNAVPGGGAYLVNDTNSVGLGVVVFTYRGLSASGTAGAYVKSASPARNVADVVYYQPVVVDIADGTTSPAPSHAINDASVTLTVDGVAPTFTKVRTADTIHIQQTSAANWAAGLHTNVVTFTDAGGTNYNYTWTWTVIGGLNGVAAADGTNAPTIPTLTGQASGAVNSSLPGWRVKPWQSAMEAGQNNSGWAEEQLEGLHSPNLANLSGTNGPGFFVWNNLWDIRYDSGGGAGGEWTYDLNDWTAFGIGAVAPGYRIIFAGVNTLTEESAEDITGWLVIPQAGTYVMYANSDDGLRVLSPQGNLFGKIGTSLVTADVGRGMTGPSVFTVTGGTYFQFKVTAPGAYPFRMVYFNGGGGGGLEWSIFQYLADGSVRQVPINDTNTPGSIKVYQALTAGDSWAPYASYMNPVLGAPDVLVYQPHVIELTDGGGKTVNSGTVVLKVDGNTVSPTVTTPSAGVTRIVWNHPTQLMSTGLHTNILTYSDNSSGTYSNWYPYNVVGPTVAITPIPASISVPTSQVDHTKPGFRVKSYQTTAGNPNTIDFTERDFLGINGANIADQTGTGGTGYFVWPNEIDFAGNIGANAASGEFRYNYMFSNFGIVQNGGATESNNCALIFSGYMEFPVAGTYTMTVNSDDGFKITFPYGGNPFGESGITVGFISAGRGNSGGNSNPFNGSSTPGTFSIPTAGAYPIRMIWENGGGGLNVEWTVFGYSANGAMHRMLVGDTNEADAIKIYQTLTTNPPSILATIPTPDNRTGPAPAVFNFGTVGGAQTTINTTDFIAVLQDGSTTINPASVQLSLNGYVQPITVTNGGGITTLFRFATNGFWPSGQYGPLLVTFQNNLGQNYTYNLGYAATPFWGTLHGGFDSSWANTNKPGFRVRAYQIDPAYTDTGSNAGPVTTAGMTIPNRTAITEQLLAGLWGPNFADGSAKTNNLAAALDFGYMDMIGTGPSNGIVNINGSFPGQNGSFNAVPWFEQPMPGLPGTGPTTINNDRFNSVALEILSYIEFPTNGTYTLGISSDDGFRVTQGWGAPTNKGALIVNSPAAVAGLKAAAMNACEQPVQSQPVTNTITGNLVLALGTSFNTTNGEGCFVSNGGALAGNIAIMYRSANCGFFAQVQNAAVAGARAAIIIQKRRPVTDGVFPEEATIAPMQAIPAIMIEEIDGNNLVAAMQTNTVNVTLTPLDHMLNPPTDWVLGQTSIGKGNSDCNFAVVVTNAPGIYPIRTVYENGGGGVNIEWYSLTGTNGARRLINDLSSFSSANGIGLRAFTSLVAPSIAIVGSNIQVTYVGILQQSTDLINWTDVGGSSPLVVPITSAPMKFYRSRYPQRL